MALLCLRSEMASGRGSLYCKTCFCFWRNGLYASDKHQQASKSTSTVLKYNHAHTLPSDSGLMTNVSLPLHAPNVWTSSVCMPHRVLSIKADTQQTTTTTTTVDRASNSFSQWRFLNAGLELAACSECLVLRVLNAMLSPFSILSLSVACNNLAVHQSIIV